MPEEGVAFVARKQLLTYEELTYLLEIFTAYGVDKVRITGGEPFVRRDLMGFLTTISRLDGLREITLTTNGSLSSEQIDSLITLGIRNVNISLDSLDKQRFFQITRRDKFDEVVAAVMYMVKKGMHVKLNAVIAEGKNTEDILPFIELTKEHPVSVRFLEEMPFNGSETFEIPKWNHVVIKQHIVDHYPNLIKVDDGKNSTSVNYQVPGYRGTFGIIASYSRTFCGTCNRLRLSATGELRTCLYGKPAINLRDLIRSGANRDEVVSELLRAVANKEKDGFEAEGILASAPKKSMSFLGG
ncbi:Molybdenum cofactor biosynthesis protein MoaA [Lunatimonas lonarensis]|uniref:Molybdenum cofactor biosynthesis protein MoaA n=2 Tax=Lunatimonas lonarensis TaxID=1232681 RepID=R7ZVZ1_9BACT|nr:Molybdenum cofactor biosynthesis protein MoaA [Lunatimonas lonarensis]